jgi:predicted transcriptional regulator
MIPQIEEIKEDVKNGKEPKTTVRELLRWFGAQRRRTNIVETIESELREAGLSTTPDFTSAWIDAEISFTKLETRADGAGAGKKSRGSDADIGPNDTQPVESREATQLISRLEAANQGVISVNPQDLLEKAVTLMLAHDYSQLPVMTNERELKGVISWKSIGSRLTQRNSLKEVKDAVEEAAELPETTSLFEATKQIIQNGFIFVRSSKDKRITGIVTATDLSEQFQRLSEPFLLLGQIENQIRNLIHGVFDLDTLRESGNDNDPDRKSRIESASDLTFGEYIRLLEKEENWNKIGFVADRKTFCYEMNEVRQIRNDVMHFDPDGIEDSQFEQLRRFSRLLIQLARLSAGQAA